MVNNLRSPEIIKLANQQSIVRVEELAEYFNVSLQTIRKDLNKLCSDGQLERVHGGAIIPSHIENIEYEQRKKINLLGKQAIGQECAKKIPNEICLFMGIGTSTETAAKLLLAHKNLLIVTNNLNIANVLKNNTKIEVVVTGGNLRKSDGALIGQPALETIKNFKFDNFLQSQEFVNKVGKIAEEEGHHPDLWFGWGYARIKIFTHAIKGLAESDFILAAKIDQISNA